MFKERGRVEPPPRGFRPFYQDLRDKYCQNLCDAAVKDRPALVLQTNDVPFTPLDREIVDATVPADHDLRRVLAAIDCEPLREQLLSSYHSTLGRPAIEPLVLLKLEFLQEQSGGSARPVIEPCRVHLAFRLFLGFSLHSPLPDPSRLTDFRERLGAAAPQQVFQQLIAQARPRGLVKDRLRLTEATHILANLAVASTLTLVAQARDQLLSAALPYAPERVAQEPAEVIRLRRATADLPDRERWAHRVVHLRNLVAWAEQLLPPGEPAVPEVEPPRQRLRQALDLAHPIDDAGDHPKAPDQVVSVPDLKARTGWHHRWFTGDSLDIAIDADSEFVTAIAGLPAPAEEAAHATRWIEPEEPAQGKDVEAMSIDSISFRGDRIAEWTDPQGLDLEVLVPPSEPARSGGFPPEAFPLDADQANLTGPAGPTTPTRERNANDTGWKSRFAARRCAGGCLRGQCMAKPKTTTGGRTVIQKDSEATYRAAREQAKTPRYQEVRRQHPKVERELGELARWHKARQARSWGTPQILIQALLRGLVVNVKRFWKLVEVPAEPTAGTVRAGLSGV